ncbi:hypothetical protein EQG49_09735 [Periweissella cryptocerci]|uniref:GP-PDE domain-containing protein n=1 Tax=Periweissella cryptocerci TaxID=2506420 RepID=A0A4P6YVD2_9LACO|nr:glycerophosphodiester phosphodiesterase family protein [Periweissella cryptocerci]QBO36721.1 hypothetical protein EQG49_09735 [Periweissella cryptocerci]
MLMKQLQRTLIITSVFLLSVPVIFSPTASASSNRTTLISHRGAQGNGYAEHTYAAYDRAIREGTRYIDTDLQSSKSGTLYVSHDATANRMTNGSGAFVKKSNAQINRLKVNVGRWGRGRGDRIHTMYAVFSRYGSRKSIKFSIELKNGAKQADAFVSLVKSLEKKYPGLRKRIIAQSFSRAGLDTVRKGLPGIRGTMKIYGSNMTTNDLQKTLQDPLITIVSVKRNRVSALKNKVHRAGKKISVYTISDTRNLKKFKKMKVDYLYTNNTARGLRVF